MMITFYILEQVHEDRALLFACDLIEKAHTNAKKVYVHTTNADDAARIDTLLWTYRDDSFLPHHVYHPDVTDHAPIQIGNGDIPPHQTDLLINFSKDIPPSFSQFNEVVEIVFEDPSIQQSARTRYKQYRDFGHSINTQKLKASEL